MKKTVAFLLLLGLCIYQYVAYNGPDQDPFLVTDYSRLHPVKVERIVAGNEEEQIVRLIREAKAKHMTVSIAGQRHSQGGHTYYKDGIVVDMTPFNKVISVDPAAKTVRVQAGATWEDVQKAVNPYGLSVRTMQSQNIFTVGGSVSINAHGRDMRNGSMIASVQSFRLLQADGQIRNVSRADHPQLFPLVLGGYGLFGVILDVTFILTDDETYRIKITPTTVTRYTDYFQRQVLGNPDIHMHIARISVAPDSFLEEMYAINYVADPTLPLDEHNTLQPGERWVIPAKTLFQLNRASDWGKNVFWKLQRKYFATQDGAAVSRNNAMRSDSAFMAYGQPGSNDLLQEYFIPVGEFQGFVEDFRNIVRKERMNLLNITVRYVQQDREAVLSYAKEDMFALVCLFHVSLEEDEQRQFRDSIRRVINQVIVHRGSYYLPYAGYPSLEQFQTAYPEQSVFFEMKRRYDPELLFRNGFYEQYKGD